MSRKVISHNTQCECARSDVKIYKSSLNVALGVFVTRVCIVLTHLDKLTISRKASQMGEGAD